MHERRRFLRTIGIGGLAGAATVMRPDRALARSGRSADLVLTCRSLRSQTSRLGSVPAVGTTTVLSGALELGGGGGVGEVQIVRTVVRSGFSVELTSLDQHVFDLVDGRLTGSGLSTRRPDLVDGFAITGGAGRYEGVVGSYSMDYADPSMGGDESATFTFHLLEGTW